VPLATICTLQDFLARTPIRPEPNPKAKFGGNGPTEGNGVRRGAPDPLKDHVRRVDPQPCYSKVVTDKAANCEVVVLESTETRRPGGGDRGSTEKSKD
jgi:hypothetical protein